MTRRAYVSRSLVCLSGVATAIYARKQYSQEESVFTSLSLTLDLALSDCRFSSCFSSAMLSGKSSCMSTNDPARILVTSFSGIGGNRTDRNSGPSALLATPGICCSAGLEVLATTPKDRGSTASWETVPGCNNGTLARAAAGGRTDKSDPAGWSWEVKRSV